MNNLSKVIWHQVISADDTYEHGLFNPGDCFCEPEVDKLGCDVMGFEHRVLRHQDMSHYAKKGKL